LGFLVRQERLAASESILQPAQQDGGVDIHGIPVEALAHIHAFGVVGFAFLCVEDQHGGGL